MANLGELEAFNDETDLKFSINGVEWVVNPPVATVLKFIDNYTKDLGGGAGVTGQHVYTHAAFLSGGEFDTENMEFKGGVLGTMAEAGYSWRAVDRAAVTIVLFFYYGKEVAGKFFTDGDLAAAFGTEAPKAGKTPKGKTEA